MAIKESAWEGVPDTQRVADGIRLRVLEHTVRNRGGYLSQACSSAEILAALYTRIMRLGPSEAPLLPPAFSGVPGADHPDAFTGARYNGSRGPSLDRFFLSPAHYALVLYAALIEVGRMAPEGLRQFNQDGSTVEMIGAEHSPGMEFTTGSLGQGLSQAAGIALARRLKGEKGRSFVFLSDGELQEGQTWETFAVLAHHRLSRIAVYVDVNGQQCDGRMANVLDVGDVAAKLRAFGAEVHDVDGHDIEALTEPVEAWQEAKPLVVLCRTDPCHALDPLRDRAPKLHYVRFKNEAEREIYSALYRRLAGEGSSLGNA